MHGLELRGGETRVERCRISAACRGKNAAAVLARGAAAKPQLLECCLHDVGGTGLLLVSKASVAAARLEVRDCAGCGVVVTPGTELRATDLVMRSCGESGLVLGGIGTVTGGTVEGCGGVAGTTSVLIKGGGRLRMDRSRIDQSSGMGIQLGEGAEAELRGCALHGCAKAGVAARGSCALLLEECTLLLLAGRPAQLPKVVLG